MKNYLFLIVCVSFLALGAGCGDDGGDGGTPDAAAGPDSSSELLPLYEACTDSTECESNLCFTYGMGQMLCTKECMNDTDCQPESTGCNNMGVCRRPGG